jgi:hypothetical protein
MAELAFLVNELRQRDLRLARRLEDAVQEAAADVEPGERLHCFVFLDRDPAASTDPRVRMRVGQLGWYRDFPPVALEDAPQAMGLAMGRLLRRQRRARA